MKVWVKIPSDKAETVIRFRRRRAIVIGVIFCLSTFSFMLFPIGWTMFFLVCLLPVYFVTVLFDLAVIPFFEKEFRLKASISLCLYFLFLVLSVLSGFLGRQAYLLKFEFQKPQYEEVVQLIQKGEIIVNDHKVEVPLKYKHLADVIYADYDAGGVLTIEFFSGRGFPLKHIGFLYRSDDAPDKWKDIRRWPRHKKVDAGWYLISD